MLRDAGFGDPASESAAALRTLGALGLAVSLTFAADGLADVVDQVGAHGELLLVRGFAACLLASLSRLVACALHSARIEGAECTSINKVRCEPFTIHMGGLRRLCSAIGRVL